MKTRRLSLLSGCAVGVAALLPGLARAQTSPAPAPQAGLAAQPAPTSGLAPAPGAQADTGNTISEIVVTAQKRTENVQKVAQTVTAISGTTLVSRGVTDLQGLSAFTPGTVFNEEGPATQIFIRGIGQTSDLDTNDPAVAVNTNQVYTPRFSLATSLFDVSSVEVLSGPQGTLYGRNAAGGTVNINTTTPGRTFGGNLLVEGGNYDFIHVSAAVNLPVTDDFSLRVAADEAHHDGYISNGANDQNSTGVRLTGLWKPTSRFSVLFHAEYEQELGKGNGIIVAPFINPKNPWFQPKFNGLVQNDRLHSYAANAEISYLLNEDHGITLTYVPGFYDYVFRHRDPVGAPINYYPDPGVVGNPLTGFAGVLDVFDDREEQVTNELRLNGDEAALKWVAGFFQYYQHANSKDFAFDVANPGAFFGGPITPYIFSTALGNTFVRLHDTSYAVYGQATYSVLPRLRVTVGGRYTTDDKKVRGQVQEGVPIAGLVFPAEQFDLSLNRDHADWKVGAEFDLTRNSLVYANVQTGFINGGFNVLAGTSSTTFRPETLTAYSVGVKNTFFHNRVKLNDEFFYYDYDNLQVSALDLASGNSQIYNVPKSRIYGDQLEGEVRLFENTSLTGNMVFLSTRIERGVLPPAATYACIPGENINPAYCTATKSNINYAGYSLPNSPSFSTSLTLTQTVPLGQYGKLQGQVGTHYETGSWGLFSHLAGLHKPAYSKTDLTLTYVPDQGRWSLSVWVKNVENTAHLSTPTTSTVYGLNTWFIEPPRTFGGRATLSF